MTKRLDEVFNMTDDEDDLDLDSGDVEEEEVDLDHYDPEEMRALIKKADKIDAALPQVTSIENIDEDLDHYAAKSMEVFDELIDLGKNVEDRHAANIFDAAGRMMVNAITAKTTKADKKLQMIKLQIQKARLEHDKDKLIMQKAKAAGNPNLIGDDTVATEGRVIATRNDIMNDILAGIREDKNTQE